MKNFDVWSFYIILFHIFYFCFNFQKFPSIFTIWFFFQSTLLVPIFPIPLCSLHFERDPSLPFNRFPLSLSLSLFFFQSFYLFNLSQIPRGFEICPISINPFLISPFLFFYLFFFYFFLFYSLNFFSFFTRLFNMFSMLFILFQPSITSLFLVILSSYLSLYLAFIAIYFTIPSPSQF